MHQEALRSNSVCSSPLAIRYHLCLPLLLPARQRGSIKADIPMLPPTRMSQKSTQSVNLPSLPAIDALSSQSKSSTSIPTKRIHSDQQLQRWISSDSHSIYLLFIARLANASVNKSTFLGGKGKAKMRQSTLKLLDLLDTFKRRTKEIEPLKTPQRFGNLAFRDWGKRLEEQIHNLHLELLPSTLHPYIPELIPYLQDSFGSFIRLDYGSGHELAFAAWLCCLTRLGFGNSNDEGTSNDQNQDQDSFEAELALIVFPSYLEVAWGLQDRYGLEPAGSHGVWGLDDYQFLPYVFGAAQLSEQEVYLPTDFVSSSHNPRSSTSNSTSSSITPSSLLLFKPSSNSRIPTSTSSSNPNDSNFSSSPFPNLFTSSIARIHSIKKGPFHEHSPILNDISSSVPNWRKVSSGMMKMYDAECLSKRPVVQHFVFGGLFFQWPGEAEGEKEDPTSHSLSDSVGTKDDHQVQEIKKQPQTFTQAPTQAPWISTRNPTSTSSSNNRLLNPSENQFTSALGPRPSTSQPWLGLASSSNRNGKSGLDDRIAYAPISIPGLGDRMKKEGSKETISDSGSAAAMSSPFGGLPKAGGGNRKL